MIAAGGKFPNLLLVTATIAVPPLLRLAKLLLLRIECQFALHQCRGLPLNLRLAGIAPLTHSVPDLRYLAMLLSQFFTELQQFITPAKKLLLLNFVLLSQLQSQFGDRLCHFGWQRARQ